jgi:NADH-quinone oxidoreductase subunit D
MKTCDTFARSYVPLLDMRESCNILRQLLEKMLNLEK